MDFLWTPWRYSYVTAAKHSSGQRQSCAFCAILGSAATDEQSLIGHRAERNFVLLNRYPYNSGHMLVVPYEQVPTLVEAPEATAAEMMRLTRRIERVLRTMYDPDGINIGMNIGRAAGAGVAGHLHMHALPRWAADSNFATVIGETRVLPESLDVTWERARAEFERS